MALSGPTRKQEPAQNAHWIIRMPGGLDWYLLPSRRLWRPPTDVYETDRHVVVQVEVAGMHEDAFQIVLAAQRLTISGQRDSPAGRLAYQNMEVNYGEFRTEVNISCPLELQGTMEATYVDGFLLVRLPKAREHRVRVRESQGS